MIAKAVSGSPIKDFLLATLISQESANSNPPPSAAPSIAAIVGKGS
jgi:hypothetical protein